MPMRARRKRARLSSSRPERSTPATSTRPPVGRSSPATIIIMVDLPEPEGPTTPTVSPAATSRSRPRRILISPAGPPSFNAMPASRIIGRPSSESYAMRSPSSFSHNSFLRRLAASILAAYLGMIVASAAMAAPIKILALGDSLTAGYGLAEADGFCPQLEKALKDAGHDVQVIDGGNSGDTTADGLARLDWSLADNPDVVIVELGGNDALRGLDPGQAKANLDAILTR